VTGGGARFGTAERDALKEIVRRRSFREGGAFTLASGRTSTIYFNLKPTLLDPEGARLVGLAVAERAARLSASHVGGLELGAVPIVAAAAAMGAMSGAPVRAVFVRKEAKAHGTKSLIEGLAEGETLEGARALVVEDVTTTGGSALRAVAALREAGAAVADLLAIVDREEGAAEAVQAAGLTLHAILTKGDFTSAA